jgi:hypothetical protein
MYKNDLIKITPKFKDGIERDNFWEKVVRLSL